MVERSLDELAIGATVVSGACEIERCSPSVRGTISDGPPYRDIDGEVDPVGGFLQGVGAMGDDDPGHLGAG